MMIDKAPASIRAIWLCLAVSCLVLAGCEEQIPAEAPVRPVISMVVGDVESFRSETYPGRATATQEINVSFEVSGKMIERRANTGDQVKSGDVLAVLESDRFEARVRRLKAEKSAAQGQLVNAENQLKRQEELLSQGFATQARVDRNKAALRTARGKVNALQAAIENAEIDLSHTTVTAPFDGTVSETFAENFQNVVAKQRILRLLDTSQIEMVVSVPEDKIGLARHVTKILVSFKTLPGVEILAKIKEISNEASLTTRTYPVTIVMDQPQGAEIKPGMAGEAKGFVQLPDEWIQKGIEIPASALFSPDDTKTSQVFVWVINEAESTVKRRQIQVVATSKRGMLIKGVKPKERIVTAGVSFLSDGQKIRILSK